MAVVEIEHIQSKNVIVGLSNVLPYTIVSQYTFTKNCKYILTANFHTIRKNGTTNFEFVDLFCGDYNMWRYSGEHYGGYSVTLSGIATIGDTLKLMAACAIQEVNVNVVYQVITIS